MECEGDLGGDLAQL